METTCKKSWHVNLASDNILWNLYTSYTEVVPKIFPNLNVVVHLVAVWAGVLACRLVPRLAIFTYYF